VLGRAGRRYLAPLLALGLLFPDPGRFPFWDAEFFAVLATGALGLVLVPKRLRAVRVGIALYLVTAIVLFFVANPMGGNLGRLAEDFSPSLAIGCALVGGRRLLAFLAIPAFAWQLTGLTSVHSAADDPSSQRAYYAPMLAFLSRHDPPARVEIPFTRDHWESTYVALKVPLARGWERQLDITNNPIFYSAAPLTADRYHAWLDEQGVSWIALPDVPLDYSAQDEAALLAHADRLPFLRLAWHDAHWKVWRVTSSPGLVTGPARLVSLDPTGFVLDATAPGSVVVRVHAAGAWSIASANACTTESSDGWTHLTVLRPGRIIVNPALAGGNACASNDRSTRTN